MGSRIFNSMAAIVLSLLSVQVQEAIASDGQPGVVLSEFIFDAAPHPQCHASTIVETPHGLVASWFGGTRERHPDVGIWVSRHADGKCGDRGGADADVHRARRT